MSGWTATRTWAVGDLPSAIQANEYWRDNLNALRSSAVGLLTGFVHTTFTAVTLATVSWDDLSVLSTSNAYQTVPWTGRFEVVLNAVQASATGTGFIGVQINHLDGSGSLIELLAQAESTSINTGVNCMGLGSFAAGERIEFKAYNSASGTDTGLAIRATVIARG